MTTKETQAQPTPREELNPASVFAHPMQVVHAKDLTTAEKRAILRSWETDARALQRADDEGMQGLAKDRGSTMWRSHWPVSMPRQGERSSRPWMHDPAFSVQVAVCVMPRPRTRFSGSGIYHIICACQRLERT